MEKTPIKKNYITKNAIKNSFKCALTLFQLTKIHKKINSVVSNIKNNEIPSIPKLKLRFKKGIHNNRLTNWKEPIDLLKKTHKNKEITNTKQEIFKAIAFNNEWFEEGTNNRKKAPIKGNTKIKINKFVTFSKKKSNINTL